MSITALAGSSSTSLASQVAPGLLGFLVVFGMAVALYFLVRSMNKQLHKVGADKRTFAGAAEPVQITAIDPPPKHARQDS
jgi:hypothetical protein